MKSNFKLVLDIREDGGIHKIEIPFSSTIKDAVINFEAFRVALKDSKFKTLDLVLCTSSTTGFRLDAVRLGAEAK